MTMELIENYMAIYLKGSTIIYNSDIVGVSPLLCALCNHSYSFMIENIIKHVFSLMLFFFILGHLFSGEKYMCIFFRNTSFNVCRSYYSYDEKNK